MKTLIAIPSCHIHRHYEQAERDTWIRNIPVGVDYKFFIGNRAGIHDAALHPYAEDETHLDVGDSLPELTLKCVEMYRWALARGYEYVWKVDLDTLVRPQQLLSSSLEAHDWVGGQNDWFASGGAGYGLSKRAMEYVVAQPIKETCAEDLHTAQAMATAGIALHHDSRFKFIPGQVLEAGDLTYHLSSVRAWDAKYQPAWMYEAYSAQGTYRPLGEPTVAKRSFRRHI